MLNNTAFKIKTEKALNIAYIGGSVTEGHGSTNKAEKSWPTLVSRWFEKTYNIKVQSVNAGIGGTDSFLGACRFDHDVAPVKPDLFFIEFAVNDFYEDYNYRTVRRQAESLLAKAHGLNPNMDVVYVLTYDLHYDTYDYPQLRAHRDVAEANGLLSIKMSDFLYARCNKTGENPHDFYIDWVHPNDYGYQTYAEIITGVLEKELEKSMGAEKLIAFKDVFQCEGVLSGAHLITGEAAYNLSGWRYERDADFSLLGKRYHGHLIAEQPGSSMMVDFEGTDFGIFFGADTKCGKLKLVVDDSECLIVNTYLWHANPKSFCIFTQLKPGKHTVKITVLEDKYKESTGTFAEIGAFLVG